MEQLADRLGGVEAAFPAYHVAGTNGKGSVSAFIASCLWAEGVAAGLFTSPPLQDPTERIVTAGHRISGPALVEAAGAVRLAVETMAEPPTAFEAWTGAAFWHFAAREVPAAVVEVGLGGRGDATSVLRRPCVSVLATVGRDHVAQLGHSLTAIAGEKAAIFRANTPALLGPLPRPATSVAVEAAARVGSPLFRFGNELRVDHIGVDPVSPTFDLQFDGPRGHERLTGLELGLSGLHQVRNAALAVAALRLGEMRGGPSVTEAAIRKGLRHVTWPGRLETAGNVLLDGAHNGHGAKALAAYMARLPGETVWVLGGLRDRPPRDLLGPLLPVTRSQAAVTVNNGRARTAAAWRAAGARHGHSVEAFSDLRDALSWASAQCRANDRVLVAGSLYLVGQARTLLGLLPAFPEDPSAAYASASCPSSVAGPVAGDRS